MRELLRRLKSRPLLAAEVALASLLINAMALVPPLYTIQVLNRYLAHGVDATLITLSVGAVAALLLEVGFRQVRLRLLAGLSAPHDRAMASEAFAALTGTRAQALEALPRALRRQVVDGVDAVRSAYGAPNAAALLDVPFAALFLVTLALLSWPLFAVAAVFIAALVGYGLLGNAHRRRLVAEATGAAARRGRLVGAAIAAADTVRAFTGAAHIGRLWEDESRTVRRLGIEADARQGLAQSVTNAAAGLMTVAMIAVAALLVVEGRLDIGAMIGANILAARALAPVVRVVQMAPMLARARQALGELRDFARLPAEVRDSPAPQDYSGRLELRDVAFAWPGMPAPLFESVSLVLEPGARLAVTGANGSGKTTFGRLVLGLAEPGRGQVLADGIDIRRLPGAWWRRQIAYLPQEPRFLPGSIRDNLLAYNPDLDDARIDSLLKAAGLKAWIDASPGGLDAPLADAGAHLALGLRRRLALARALACDGRLVVFDEPAEGLDGEGARHVAAALSGAAGLGRTVVVLTHDPRTVHGATHILDLDAKPVPRLVEPHPAQAAGAAQ